VKRLANADVVRMRPMENGRCGVEKVLIDDLEFMKQYLEPFSGASQAILNRLRKEKLCQVKQGAKENEKMRNRSLAVLRGDTVLYRDRSRDCIHCHR